MKTSAKIVLVAMFLLWMLPGLIGRDPWKADEPYSFGMVDHIARTGDWIVPAVAGEPFLEKPPLYYLSAALAERAFSFLLEPHDAARTVNILWMALTMLFLGLSVSETAGERAAWTAPVQLMGCVLLQIAAHKILTDVALLTGFSSAMYGLAISRRRPGWGGFWTGTGLGVGFMAKGLLAPGIIGTTSLALPLLFPAWRRKEYARALALAAIAALPWLIIWPAALFLRSREYFVEWFWYQNLGRFLGFAYVGVGNSHWYFVLHLIWMGIPVLPFACWSLWQVRSQWRSHPAYQLPLVFFLVVFLVLSASSSIRDLYALPLLLPLIMIAASGIAAFPKRTAAMIDSSSTAFFGIIGLLCWTVWLVRISGSSLLNGLLPVDTDHYEARDPVLIGAALLYTVLWMAATVAFARRESPLLTSWTAGMILIWGLAMTLWLPWLESAASYRYLFTSLRTRVPEQYSCVASYSMGESERAMAEYYAGLRTRPLEMRNIRRCDLLLVGYDRGQIDFVSERDWKVIWEGVRPRDHPKEHYTLYQLRSRDDRKRP